MIVVFLSLGSNQGGSFQNIKKAISLIKKLPRTRHLITSSFYRTSPVGFTRQPDFLNAAVKIKTSLSPIGLLVYLKRIEFLLGRRASRRWGPRPMDIDILQYGNKKLKSTFLTLPHPRMLKRKFVLAPLAEIEPHFARFLRRLNAPSQSVKIVR
ncbi:MAG: 2-amino-4-hydroxy-6-hydroxymethyldihydropteridine diphosphokinase [Elusimicrobia bacterium]|nr:2-amino-4-hydroxy-6-hydroxymethyldihydropteridine diphosphokinase [Elusimicrobiota bacterium]